MLCLFLTLKPDYASRSMSIFLSSHEFYQKCQCFNFLSILIPDYAYWNVSMFFYFLSILIPDYASESTPFAFMGFDVLCLWTCMELVSWKVSMMNTISLFCWIKWHIYDLQGTRSHKTLMTLFQISWMLGFTNPMLASALIQ